MKKMFSIIFIFVFFQISSMEEKFSSAGSSDTTEQQVLEQHDALAHLREMVEAFGGDEKQIVRLMAVQELVNAKQKESEGFNADPRNMKAMMHYVATGQLVEDIGCVSQIQLREDARAYVHAMSTIYGGYIPCIGVVDDVSIEHQLEALNERPVPESNEFLDIVPDLRAIDVRIHSFFSNISE